MTRGLVVSILDIIHKEKLSYKPKKSPFNLVLKRTFPIYRNLLNILIKKPKKMFHLP